MVSDPQHDRMFSIRKFFTGKKYRFNLGHGSKFLQIIYTLFILKMKTNIRELHVWFKYGLKFFANLLLSDVKFCF